jgi:hypothetical protein
MLVYIAVQQKSTLHFTKICVTLIADNNKYQKGIKVQRKTRSLLEELNDISVKKDSEAFIEARAGHVIDSAINLLALIKENFDPETAYELERRLINSIKGADPSKFTRGIRKLRDSKETAKNLTIINGNLESDSN